MNLASAIWLTRMSHSFKASSRTSWWTSCWNLSSPKAPQLSTKCATLCAVSRQMKKKRHSQHSLWVKKRQISKQATAISLQYSNLNSVSMKNQSSLSPQTLQRSQPVPHNSYASIRPVSMGHRTWISRLTGYRRSSFELRTEGTKVG